MRPLYHLREEIRGLRARAGGFDWVTIPPGATVEMVRTNGSGIVELAGAVDLMYQGNVVAAFGRDVEARCDRANAAVGMALVR